jgi:hypothetical protein
VLGVKDILVPGWESGQSGRVPTLQVQGPEFKPQYLKKEKYTCTELIYSL